MLFLFLPAALAIAEPNSAELDKAIALLDRLDATIISVEYRNQRLDASIEDLNTRLPAPVRADWKSLERLGVRADDRVTLTMAHASAASVLSGLALNLGDEMERPIFESYGGQIVLTTLEGSAMMRLTDVYDVRDLLANDRLLRRLRDEAPPIPDETEPAEAPSVTPDHHAEPAAPAGPGRPQHQHDDRPRARRLQNIDIAPIEPPANDRPKSSGEKLLLLITDHVDPDAWMNFGGDRGLITEFNGSLMVTATPSTHRRFRQALRLLRAANPVTVEIESALIEVSKAKFDSLARQYTGNSSALAAATLSDVETKNLWHTANPVAVDSPLQVDSSAEQIQIHVAMQPSFETETGILRLAIDAQTIEGQDRRNVKTTIALPSDQNSALVELPSAGKQEKLRFLAISVQRR